MVNLKFLTGFHEYVLRFNKFFKLEIWTKNSNENRPYFSRIWFGILFWTCKENLIVLHWFHTINFKFKKWFTVYQKFNLTFCWVQFRVNYLNLSSGPQSRVNVLKFLHNLIPFLIPSINIKCNSWKYSLWFHSSNENFYKDLKVLSLEFSKQIFFRSF